MRDAHLATETLPRAQALLLARVSDRASALQAAAAEDRWPARELRALTECLQADLLPLADAEEALLFPAAGGSPAVARLMRDHARLRAVASTLARAAAGEGSQSPAQLAATTRDLLSHLSRHFRAEQALLAAASRRRYGAPRRSASARASAASPAAASA